MGIPLRDLPEHVQRLAATSASDRTIIPAPGQRKIRFIIPGPPVGKPRMTRRDKWKQRDCVMRYRAWADLARDCAGKLPPAETVVRLNWVAYFDPPKSWPKHKREAVMGQLHRAKPDRDNIDKAVLDSLFNEDSGVAAGTIEKVWGSPARLEVEVVAPGPEHGSVRTDAPGPGFSMKGNER